MNRRKLLTDAFTLMAAPAIVGATSLMPAKARSRTVTTLPLDLRNLCGLCTKWKTYSYSRQPSYSSDPGLRATIQPDLCGKTPTKWLAQIQAIGGVNALQLNLDPAIQLNQTRYAISAQEWGRYIRAMFSNSDFDFLKSIQKRIDLMGYTEEQRNDLLEQFLVRLEAGLGIDYPERIPFFLHQRNYIVKQKNVDEFIAEMARFINRIKSHPNPNLINWIAGVRLGEHNRTDMNFLQRAIVHMATGINAATGNWLKGRAMIANGGALGDTYHGFNTAAIMTNFFPRIAAQTDSFAMGYKLLEEGKSTTDVFLASACGGHACNDTVSDWQYWILNERGLRDFLAAVSTRAAAFPRHTGMVFVGDSGDAAKTFVSGHESKIRALPRYKALSQIFSSPGFRGKLFMIPVSNATDYDSDTHDIGRNMTYSDGNNPHTIWDWVSSGSVKRLPNTTSLWTSWPNVPPTFG